jgi:Flp pilus assembly pilin Flp
MWKNRGGTVVKNTLSFARELLCCEDGATLVEYTLLLLLIAMVALVSIKTYGLTVAQKMSNNQNSVANAIN